jgi:hypothetical protein
MLNKRLTAVAASIICLLFAAECPATKLAGEFLATGFGARALGMGGAYVSVADDASAVYWNPAGLVQMDRSQLLLMHSERFGDLINYNTFSLARPISREPGAESFGAVSLVWLRVDDIAITSHLNEPDVDFEDLNGNGVWDPGTERRLWNPDRVRWESDDEIAGYLSYSHTVNPKLSVGVNAKIIWKEIAEISALGFGLDAGLIYEPFRNWRLGLNVQDITTTPLYWDGWYYTDDQENPKYKVSTKETIYPTAKIGTSYSIPVGALAGRLIVAADVDFRFEGLDEEEADFAFSDVSGDVRLGAMYEFRRMLRLSFGMDRQKPSAGIGLSVAGFGVDYAFWSDEDLDNTHRISAVMDF